MDMKILSFFYSFLVFILCVCDIDLLMAEWNDDVSYLGGEVNYLIARPDTGEVRITGGGLHEWKQKLRAGGFTNGPNGIHENGGGDDIFLGVILEGLTWSTAVPTEVGRIHEPNGWFLSGGQTGEGDVMASYPGATSAIVFVRVYPPDWQPGNSMVEGEDEERDFVSQATLMAGSEVIARSALQIQNFPNPFNPSTTFSYRVPDGDSKHIILAIYSLRGQRLATLMDGVQEPGEYQVHWNGVDNHGERIPSGIYLYRFAADKEMVIRKMTILK